MKINGLFALKVCTLSGMDVVSKIIVVALKFIFKRSIFYAAASVPYSSTSIIAF